jgi:hypothetical protein
MIALGFLSMISWTLPIYGALLLLVGAALFIRRTIMKTSRVDFVEG